MGISFSPQLASESCSKSSKVTNINRLIIVGIYEYCNLKTTSTTMNIIHLILVQHKSRCIDWRVCISLIAIKSQCFFSAKQSQILLVSSFSTPFQFIWFYFGQSNLSTVTSKYFHYIYAIRTSIYEMVICMLKIHNKDIYQSGAHQRFVIARMRSTQHQSKRLNIGH